MCAECRDNPLKGQSHQLKQTKNIKIDYNLAIFNKIGHILGNIYSQRPADASREMPMLIMRAGVFRPSMHRWPAWAGRRSAIHMYQSWHDGRMIVEIINHFFR